MHPAAHLQMLDTRTKLSVADYERVFLNKVPYAADDYVSDTDLQTGDFRLDGVNEQERQYRHK